jgi:hypothetical protein
MFTKSITVGEAIDIIDAISIVDNNSSLDAVTMYWLATLSNTCKAISQPAIKEQEKQRRKILAEIKLNPERKKELSAEFESIVENLLNVEQEISAPKFKISMFQAPEDMYHIDAKGSQLLYRKGQSLVPTKFFKLLAPFIEQ